MSVHTQGAGPVARGLFVASLLVGSAGLVLWGGCHRQSRAWGHSSRSVLSRHASSLRFTGARAAVTDLITRELLERGIHLVEQREAGPWGRLMIYRKIHPTVLLHAIEAYSRRDTLSSVYYVQLKAAAGGLTEVLFLGKPTENGREQCSRHDLLPAPCNGINATWINGYPGSGRQEAEVVRSVILSLQQKYEQQPPRRADPGGRGSPGPLPRAAR